MGRPRRIQFAGACYRVLLRGNNRQDLFLSNQDRRRFLAFLRSAKERWRLKVYAYCLLPAEAHLLLETEEPNLAEAMQAFTTAYAKRFNSRHRMSGHLFAGRYQAALVDKEKALAEATAFVHLQPARTGSKDKPWRYPWSSCAAYVEEPRPGSLLDRDLVLAQFGKGWLKQSVRYLSFIKSRVKSAAELTVPPAVFAAPRPGGPPVPAPDRAFEAGRILAEVALESGIPEEKLLSRLQWRDIAAARRVAIHRLWKELGLRVTDLARMFGRTPSSVSQIIRAREMPRFR